MRRSLLALLLMLSAVTYGQTVPTGFIPVTGSKILDATGTPISNATLCGQVMSGSTGYSALISGGGHTTSPAVCTQVASGAFTINLPDTNLTKPQNACVAITVTDNTTGEVLLGNGYGCVQPTSVANSPWCSTTACNFDLYQPNLPSVAVIQTGPVGPTPVITVDGVTALPYGSVGNVMQSGTALAPHFHFSLPSAPPGTFTANSVTGNFYTTNTSFTSGLNTDLFAGTSTYHTNAGATPLFATVQAAVTQACANGGGQVILPQGTNITDNPATAAVPCNGVSISDQRGNGTVRWVPGANHIYREGDMLDVVSEFGCVGDGIFNSSTNTWSGTNNDACFVAAKLRVNQTHGTLYFPHGVYLWQNSPLIFDNNGFTAVTVVGEEQNSTVVVHNSSSYAANASFDWEPQSGNASPYFGAGIRDITVIGGAADTSAVAMRYAAYAKIRNLSIAGATQRGLDLYFAVGGYADNVQIDEFAADRFGGPTNTGVPHTGILFDGVSSNAQTTPFMVNAPKITHTALAIDIENAAGISLANCQVTANTQSLNISDLSSQNHVDTCLFENETTPSYIGGWNNYIYGGAFTQITGAAVGVRVGGRGNTLQGVGIGSGPLQVLAGAQNTAILSPNLNSIPLAASGSDQGLGIIDLGLGTRIADVHFTIGQGGQSFPENEVSPASGSGQANTSNVAENLGPNSVHEASGVVPAGTPSAPAYMSYARYTPAKSWRLLLTGHFGSLFGAGDETAAGYYELTETNNTVKNPDGTMQTFAVNAAGVLTYTTATATGGNEYFQGSWTFIPDVTATASGLLSMHLAGGLEFTGSLATAPTAGSSCTVVNQYVFSNDGHLSFCTGTSGSSTWAVKF